MDRRRYYDSHKPYHRPRSRQQRHSSSEYDSNNKRRECNKRFVKEVTCSQRRKSWYEMVEEEEYHSRTEDTEFHAQHLPLMEDHPRFVDDRRNNLEMLESSSNRKRQDSCLSTSGSSWSNDTSESSLTKKAMSMTPRFTHEELESEEVQAILERRQKQIEYGKVQECYQQYCKLVPRAKRTKYHPRTPDINRKYSRRGFDTLIRVWKKQLHAWEPNETKVQTSGMELPCEGSVTTSTTDDAVPIKEESKDIGDVSESCCPQEFQSSAFHSSTIKVEPVEEGFSDFLFSRNK